MNDSDDKKEPPLRDIDEGASQARINPWIWVGLLVLPIVIYGWKSIQGFVQRSQATQGEIVEENLNVPLSGEEEVLRRNIRRGR